MKGIIVFKWISAVILVFLSIVGVCMADSTVVVVQSALLPPYEQVLSGFRMTCPSRIQRIVLADQTEDVVDRIRKAHPDLLLAIGSEGLRTISHIRDIPIVYTMVLKLPPDLVGRNNISGVNLSISPETQIHTLTQVLPDVEHIGLIYDPYRTGSMVEDAQRVCNRLDIRLLSQATASASRVPSLLRKMAGRIDVFWMLPDLTVVTPDTSEHIILFCIEHRIPVLTFSEKYVDMGAFMAVGIDPNDIGKQGGDLAHRILSENPALARGPHLVDVRKGLTHINFDIAKRLGIHIDHRFSKRSSETN